MNSVVRQLHEQGTDVVMVDTGNSYEGLCEYLGGKYISYTEEKPITMNPFNITQAELNIEKIDFLKNLILLIWKGSDTKVTELEFRIVEQMVTDYYDAYFHGFDGYDPVQRETLRKTLIAAEKRKGTWGAEEMPALEQKVDDKIRMLEERRKALKVTSLSFNTFYEYSCERLELICLESNITEIDYDKYAYMIQPFYNGGNYDKILNENVDTTLFSETFIVFEVDAIKENKKLFPIVTLIIMDVFLQKMRIKKNRKVLVIEEAWKAIASPLMAEYIKFMYKTARKFWASVGVVTQEIQDIIAGDTGHHRQRDREGSHHQQLRCGDAARPEQVQGTLRQHQGHIGPDRRGLQEDIYHQPSGEQGRAQLLPRGLHPSRFDQRRVRRGGTARMLHDLHHRACGEGGFETVQGRTGMHSSGGHRSLLPRLGCQRHKQIVAVRPEGEHSGACTQSEKEG